MMEGIQLFKRKETRGAAESVKISEETFGLILNFWGLVGNYWELLSAISYIYT